MTVATDWDQYYQNTPKYTSLTRKISEKKVIKLMQRYGREGTAHRVCELGGANSCFVAGIFGSLDISEYHVVDFNEFGLSLLSRKKLGDRLTWVRGDVLDTYSGEDQFDFVYSVGLVEHFQPVETRRAIQHHFDRCSAGGVVLITFPTPTLLYRTIRSAAERLGKWSFPDERPLQFDEVRTVCQQHGDILHQSINWAIGLTQGYILTRKRA